MSDRTVQWWNFQWKRIKETLSIEQRDKKLNELRDLIDDLRITLQVTDKRLDANISNAISSFPNMVQKVRMNSHSLYSALKNGWRCHCIAPHTTLLQLENRKGCDLEPRFNVLFIMPRQQSCDGHSSHRDSGGGNEKQTAKDSVRIQQRVETKVVSIDQVEIKLPDHVGPLSTIAVKQSVSGVIEEKGFERETSLGNQFQRFKRKFDHRIRYGYFFLL
jgi:hypothetical protein